MTVRAGVIGWPVAHSLSPVLHGHWLKQYGIDGTYEKIAAAPEDFGSTIAGLRAQGYSGVNVTVPHKEAAFALADTRHPAAANAKAANLLVFKQDGTIGADNTDGTGLVDSLGQALGPVWLGGRHVVLLGAGGAARGADFALYQHHVAKVTVLNRNPQRARALADHARAMAPDGNFAAGSLEDWPQAADKADLVINTTAAGMMGNPPLAIDLGALPKGAAVCDIVYNPLETPLLADARARGHKTIDGLGMLMHQAAPSFEAFFGVRPQVTPELRAVLERELKARG
jgi:shikimate dehydrogenase